MLDLKESCKTQSKFKTETNKNKKKINKTEENRKTKAKYWLLNG